MQALVGRKKGMQHKWNKKILDACKKEKLLPNYGKNILTNRHLEQKKFTDQKCPLKS